MRIVESSFLLRCSITKRLAVQVFLTVLFTYFFLGIKGERGAMGREGPRGPAGLDGLEGLPGGIGENFS